MGQPPELDSDIVGRAWKGFNMTECANFCFLHSQCKFWSYNIRWGNTCPPFSSCVTERTHAGLEPRIREDWGGRRGKSGSSRDRRLVGEQVVQFRSFFGPRCDCCILFPFVSFKDQLTDRQMLLRLERCKYSWRICQVNNWQYLYKTSRKSQWEEY